ncbi:hypothetical protein [Geovibrio sp. ADMFC3]
MDKSGTDSSKDGTAPCEAKAGLSCRERVSSRTGCTGLRTMDMDK